MSQFHTFFSAEPIAAKLINKFQKTRDDLTSRVEAAAAEAWVVKLVKKLLVKKFPRWDQWIEDSVRNFTLGAHMTVAEMKLALINMNELLTLLSSEEGIKKFITCKKKGAGPLSKYFPFTFMEEDLEDRSHSHYGFWTFWKWENNDWTRNDTNYH